MEVYPYTLFPHLLVKDVTIESYINECLDKPPVEPKKPVRQKVLGGCLTVFAFYVIATIVASGVVSLSISIPFGLVLLVAIWIIFSTQSQIQFSKDVKEYDREYSIFLIANQDYKKKTNTIKTNIESSSKNGNENWKYELIKKRLLKLSFKFESGIGKKGISEEFFVRHLIKYFDCIVYQNVPIDCYGAENKYYPDIVLYFRGINLAVAIEIDEPYTLKDGTPIHYYYYENGVPSYSDDEMFISRSSMSFTSRSDEISKKGIILIRFAEEQVILQPQSCCKYLRDKIETRLGVEISDRDFTDISEIRIINGWTFDEAKKMYQNRYRENYLKTINYLSENS